MSRWFKLAITVFALFISAQLSANECYSKFPVGTVPLGNVKICQSGFTGLKSHYSCQDYHHEKGDYRVIYKGGLEPKAIVKLSSNSESLIWSPSWGDHKMRCPLPAPETISKHARHRGVGVCMNNNDENVPCSVYEHAEARQSRAWRYLVFYGTDGKAELVHTMAAGDNENAMVAELAYQLGISLLETSCCSEQASAYLEHAHRLFPKATAYRVGYLQALEQLAANEGDGTDL